MKTTFLAPPAARCEAHAEVEQVHRHFVDVDATVGARDVRSMDPNRRLARALLFDELTRYRRARRLPKNREFRNQPVPCFIDADGTRCAVAHLLEVSGQPGFARTIAEHTPYVRVRELAGNSDLVAWLDATGITLEEAERIQPSYCFVTLAVACFCSTVAPHRRPEGMRGPPGGRRSDMENVAMSGSAFERRMQRPARGAEPWRLAHDGRRPRSDLGISPSKTRGRRDARSVAVVIGLEGPLDRNAEVLGL